MFRSFAILAAGASAFAMPAAAQAQAADAAQPVTRASISQKLDEAFKKMDANNDGAISKTEIQSQIDREMVVASGMVKQRQQQDFQKLDTDKNGQLSLAEYQAQASVKAKAGAADTKLQELDTDKNQKVTLAEFRTSTLAQFDKLDKNKDGTLSPQERTPAGR